MTAYPRFLSPADTARVAQVCAHWRFLAQKNSLWQHLCIRRWRKLAWQYPDAAESPVQGGNEEEGVERDSWKKSYITRLKYDRHWQQDSVLQEVRRVKGHQKTVYCVQLVGVCRPLTKCPHRHIKLCHH